MAIQTVKYFSGTQELNGIHHIRNDQFARAFPAVTGKRADSFSRWVGHPVEGPDAILPVDRIIEYKRNPSLHKCDARCQHARGRQCECSCGGRNHGAGQ